MNAKPFMQICKTESENSQSGDSPKFIPGRPSTELFELAGAVQAGKGSKAKRETRPSIQVRSGSSVVKIFVGPAGKGPFTVAWREGAGGKRARVMRTALASAKRFADEKAIALANGELWRAAVSQNDIASYKRSLELIAPTGMSLELGASIIAEAMQILRGHPAKPSIIEAVRFYMEQNSRTNIVPKTCPEIALEVLAKARKDGAGGRWLRTLESQLDRFTEKFTGPLNILTADKIDAWLDSLKVASHTQKNYRSAVMQLVNFAKAKRYVGKDWREMDDVDAPKVRDGKIKILSPDDLVKLLHQTADNMIPFTAIAAFAGVRHEEMNGEKCTLDWSDINFKEKSIFIPADDDQHAEDRIVPMSENLIAWLRPHAKTAGPIVTLVKTSGAICRAKKRAGIPAGKNETRNTLRKSFISYRLARVKNIAQVAEESGNSIAKIKERYRKPVLESLADRWFDIWPTTAGILQLNLKMA